MAENHDLLKCPVCQGHGEFLCSEVVEQLTSGELKSRLDTLLAEVIPPGASLELATAAVRDGESRDFQKGCAQLESPTAHVATEPEGVSSAGRKCLRQAEASQPTSLFRLQGVELLTNSPNGCALRRRFL
jgi:hypothetical protein